MAQSPRLLSGLRHRRYGEVLLVYPEAPARVEVFNSFTLNDCPDDLWRAMDLAVVARANGAALAIGNGPRYWLMDAISKVDPVEPVIRDFGGIAMRRVAVIEPAGEERAPYREVVVHRGAAWHFDVGSTVHLLHHGDTAYVMQAYCVGVDPGLTAAALTRLGARLQLPSGWRYETRRLGEELVVDTTTSPARVLQDEFENTYCRLD
jgi:hypothetical protein